MRLHRRQRLGQIASIQRANVTVYPMHLMRNVRYHATEQNLYRLADETGGDTFDLIPVGIPDSVPSYCAFMPLRLIPPTRNRCAA